MSHAAVVEFPGNSGNGQESLDVLRAALVDTRTFEGCGPDHLDAALFDEGDIRRYSRA